MYIFRWVRQKSSTNLQEQIELPCWPEGRRAGARSKKRSLHVVYRFAAPHFETIFNAAIAEKMLRAKLSKRYWDIRKVHAERLHLGNCSCVTLLPVHPGTYALFSGSQRLLTGHRRLQARS